MAAGVTDTLWTMADVVGVVDRWEAQQRGQQPVYELEANKIGDGHLARVTFPDGKTETVYGFKSKLDAAKWIRCEAVVWFYERRRAKRTVCISHMS